MRYAQAIAVLAAFLLVPSFLAPLHAQAVPESANAGGSVRITEFMAANTTGLDDEDRDEEDWIEIYNAGPAPANLEGWYLTDRANNLTQWKFPAVTLAPDTYLVVFASGKDRRDPTRALHTNFRLSGSGEYLGLVCPDGVTIASEYAPAYPIQAPDVSYGLNQTTSEQVLLAQGAPARALLPQDDALEPPPQSDAPRPWTLEDFDDSTWLTGVTGIGYGYWKLVGLDVGALSTGNESVYVRVPFVVEDPSVITSLTLRMWQDDGMIAYINGQEVVRDNAPAPGDETWNSGAPAAWPGTRVPSSKDFPIRRFDLLHVGMNLLAVQGLNYGASNPDLLVLPELLARVVGKEPSFRYFPVPTPGRTNDAGVEVLGPIIADAEHRPLIPTDRTSLQITARITAASAPVSAAELHYQIMFDTEVAVPFRDDGFSGDGGPADGVFGARIPASTFHPGQMVRWYITALDTAGRRSRFPAYLDPLNSPQYCGTIVLDPTLRNPLPVLHWFVQNPGAADSDGGTRCSLFYDGEFYDNVWVNVHGQSSRGFPKKSHDIDFHPGHNFKWDPNQPRADDINLMTTYPDKAQMRNILAYETYRDADCPYHWVFPVRVQQNGEFWGTAHAMENGDRDWLIRMGLNADGALYKMYNTFTSASHTTSGAEKKTRRNEDNADLLELYNGVTLAGDARRRYLYDNVDVAQVVDFLAARIITGDTDCCHKNYYLYRDTGHSNEWQMWPWDVDLTFGRVWTSAKTYWDHTLNPRTPLFIGDNNRVPQAIFDTPEIRQMYLRRIRTLMDELLMPPGTPVEALHYEPRIDELAAQLAPDAALDAAKWNSHAWGNGSTAPNYPQSLPQAVAELKDSYLPERRRQLFNRLAPRSGEIPPVQPANATILFAAIETQPAGGNRDEQYIQLLNPNGFAVDISGWTLSVGDIAPVHLFTFRGGTVIPIQGTLYVAANRPAFRARGVFPSGGQALFVVGDFAGWLASQPEILTLTNRQGQPVASTHTR